MKLSVIVAAGLLSFPVANVSAQSVTDAQIASIVVTANQVDVDAGMPAFKLPDDFAQDRLLGLRGVSVRESQKVRAGRMETQPPAPQEDDRHRREAPKHAGEKASLN